jgi:hypothetical protein
MATMHRNRPAGHAATHSTHAYSRPRLAIAAGCCWRGWLHAGFALLCMGTGSIAVPRCVHAMGAMRRRRGGGRGQALLRAARRSAFHRTAQSLADTTSRVRPGRAAPCCAPRLLITSLPAAAYAVPTVIHRR